MLMKAPQKTRGVDRMCLRVQETGGKGGPDEVLVAGSRIAARVGLVFAFCFGVGFGGFGFEQVEVAKDLGIEVFGQGWIGFLFGFQAFAQTIEQADDI